MADEYLEKIDIIRERLGVGYKEAKEALDDADGDVVAAIIKLEEGDSDYEEKMRGRMEALVNQVREILRKGQVTKIRVKKGDRVITEIPAAVGALGVVGMLASAEFAILAGLGTVAAMLNDYSLEIEKKDGETEEHEIEID